MLGPLNKLVPLVHVLFASLQVQSVQVIHNLDGLSDAWDAVSANFISRVFLLQARRHLNQFDRLRLIAAGLLVHLLVPVLRFDSRLLLRSAMASVVLLIVGRVLFEGV